MQCPKCSSGFERVTYGEVEVDRCVGCQGLWFDMLEKDDLLKIEGSESIDVGSAEQGQRFDASRRINCPKCNVRMLSMVDMTQAHIHYESCPTCYGTFFDAGEFRDLKELTVVERFTSMVDTLRSNL